LRDGDCGSGHQTNENLDEHVGGCVRVRTIEISGLNAELVYAVQKDAGLAGESLEVIRKTSTVGRSKRVETAIEGRTNLLFVRSFLKVTVAARAIKRR
jgi:hypothetical protein